MRGVRFVYQFRRGIEMHLTDGSAVMRDRAVSVGIFLKLRAQISPDGAAEMLRQVCRMYFLYLQESIYSGESGLPAKPAACIAFCQNGLLILKVRKI